MKPLHLIFGVGLLVIFLLTGQYMDFQNPPVRELEDGARMMFRSRHIYILLAGLINLGLGAYFMYRDQPWRKVLQFVGSGLVIVGPLLMIGAFFYEPPIDGLKRTFTLPAILALVFGVFCHVISGLRQDRKTTSP